MTIPFLAVLTALGGATPQDLPRADAPAGQLEAAQTTITGLPALLIILAILALLIIGVVSVVRFIGSRAKR